MPRTDSSAASVPVRTATLHRLHMKPPCVIAMDDGFDFRPMSARGSLVKAPRNDFTCGHVYGILRSDLLQIISVFSKPVEVPPSAYSSPSCRGPASVVESISRAEARRGSFLGLPLGTELRVCMWCVTRTGIPSLGGDASGLFGGSIRPLLVRIPSSARDRTQP